MKRSLFGFGAVVGIAVVAAAQIGAAAAYAASVTGSLGSSVNAVVSSTLGGGANANANANGNVNTNTSGSASNASGSLNVGVGLQAALQSGTVATSSDSAIVNLQGNAAALIESTSDLQAYGNLVVAARPAVKQVSVNNTGTVAIKYAQPAKFLWIFPTMITGEVDVDASGTASVHLPWYAFLYAADTASVQSTANTAVAESGAGFTTQANTAADLQNRARIVNAVTAALEAQAEADATSTTSSQ